MIIELTVFEILLEKSEGGFPKINIEETSMFIIHFLICE